MYGASLRVYLQLAYRLPPDRVSGPAWMDSERYDIAATMPANTPDAQVPLMLQTLLQERFQIKLHREQKETAVYALVVNKGGPRLKEAVEGTPPVVQLGGVFRAKNRSLNDLASILMRWTDRPVVNLTGLDGYYDFELEWSHDAAPSSGPASDPNGPLSALPQFGLRAEKRKVPLEFLVIDHAEKVPIAN